MFKRFSKKERPLPPFNDLQNSSIKDLYFVRLAQWDKQKDNNIYVVDNHAPRIITLDPWPQYIFLEADGQKTVSAFIYDIASKYGKHEEIPEKLDASILQEIEGLLELKLIALSKESKKLPYYIELPKQKQNLEKANELMLADGFIKE